MESEETQKIRHLKEQTSLAVVLAIEARDVLDSVIESLGGISLNLQSKDMPACIKRLPTREQWLKKTFNPVIKG